MLGLRALWPLSHITILHYCNMYLNLSYILDLIKYYCSFEKLIFIYVIHIFTFYFVLYSFLCFLFSFQIIFLQLRELPLIFLLVYFRFWQILLVVVFVKAFSFLRNFCCYGFLGWQLIFLQHFEDATPLSSGFFCSL